MITDYHIPFIVDYFELDWFVEFTSVENVIDCRSWIQVEEFQCLVHNLKNFAEAIECSLVVSLILW